MKSGFGNILLKLRACSHPWQLALFLVLVAVTLWYSFKSESGPEVSQATGKWTGTCVRVIDGDTIEVMQDGREEITRIDLIGVDAMELHDEDIIAGQAARHSRRPEHIRKIGEKARETLRDIVLNLRVEWEIPAGTRVEDSRENAEAYVLVKGDDLAEYLLLLGLAVPEGEDHRKAGRYREIAKPLIQ